ncbi:SCO family protein [Nitratireductor basaltis]|uniref:Electron transport protein SCO1/SenC n=1 Tax=Nitratireductor basaltis TaxID=472175 RepID=A0A084U9S5_9HYPH|nr:SCO family protein [Nitratireductor basaltis]KFB09711.1 Electron transport protein SCO1/SenC [Nitratireductor basaltis]
MMRAILIAIIVVMAAAVGYMTYQWYRSEPEVVSFGTPFQLVNQDGEPVTEEAFKGSPTALFFGFTHCPDVCPTTLFEMQSWLEQLGAEAEDLDVYFVTVDPERDTPEILKAYVGNFSDRIQAITGEPEKVAEMVKGFRIFSRRVELEDGDYTMDHTASVMLLDRKGDFFGTIAYEENPETAIAKLRRLINEG